MSSPLIHRQFKLPSGCSCSSFVIRETTGVDEQQAAFRADAREGRTTVYAELVRLSIVKVNGEKVSQPFMELENWNSKTRALLRRAYDSINDLSEEEVEVFLQAGEEVTLEPATESQTA